MESKSFLVKFLRGYYPFIAKYINRLEIRGLENIISPGSKLIAVNHGGGWDYDNFVLMSMLDHIKTQNPARKNIWLCVWDKWCDSNEGIEGFWSDIYRRYSVIPIHIEKKGKPPIPWDTMDKIVDRGEIIAICPEGHSAARYEGYRLWKFYPGVIKIHLKYKIPILPTALIGFVETIPILKNYYNANLIPPWEKEVIPPLPIPIPWKKLFIHIGEPIYFDEYYDKVLSKATYFKLANVIKNKIADIISMYRKDITEKNTLGSKNRIMYKSNAFKKDQK